MHQTLFVFCTVVVPHNRHGTVSQAKNGHKDKGLQLKVNAQYRNCRLRKDNQDIV